MGLPVLFLAAVPLHSVAFTPTHHTRGGFGARTGPRGAPVGRHHRIPCRGRLHDEPPSVPMAVPEERTGQRTQLAKGKGPSPVLVLGGDTLETRPKHVALVTSAWLVSLIALKPVLDLWTSSPSPEQLVSVSASALASVIFSDLFSGLFHWVADNYGNGRTPILGGVIEAFQGHHVNPWTITHRSFFNNVHKIAQAAIPLTLLVCVLTTSPEARLFWVIFFNAQILSQEFHKLSHTVKPPPWASWLQARNLILSRKEHGLHHSSPFESHYCILTGICNKPLDRFNVWRRLEAIVYRVNGVEPNCWKEDPSLKKFSLSPSNSK